MISINIYDILHFIGVMIFYYLAGGSEVKTLKEWLKLISVVTITVILIKSHSPQ